MIHDEGNKGAGTGKNKAEYLFRERSSVEALVEFQIELMRVGSFANDCPFARDGLRSANVPRSYLMNMASFLRPLTISARLCRETRSSFLSCDSD